ncbi:MAG: TolC family protein [Pseudomonadota bacterium]
MKIIRWIVIAACLWTSPTALANKEIGIAVVTDGPAYQLREVEAEFREELIALIGNEFDLRFRNLVADWSVASVDNAMNDAFSDPSVDLVLVLGFAANQLSVSRDAFPKPTFLPLVFNPDLLNAPTAQTGSGKRNLNYLADRVPFVDDLASFQEVVPFASAVILTDSVIIESIPTAPAFVRSRAENVDFRFVGHDGVNHDLLNAIPDGTEAVLLGGLPRLPRDAFDALLTGLAERQLPSFSLVSEAEVVRGALASDTVQTDYQRLARRNALNMQAVLLGERTEDQPVFYDGKRQLTINMETARAIDLSPRFAILGEAELINPEPASEGPSLDLATAARMAINENLDLAAARFDVTVGEQNVATARANLLPQITVGASTTQRRANAQARMPISQERSTAAALTLNQLIYSESARAGYQQEQSLQTGRVAGLDTVRLDQVLNTTTAYLQAIRAGNQLRIQRDNLSLTKRNLDLATNRAKAGSASNADVFRWEANLASARSAVLNAIAAQRQAFDALNRLLNRPIGPTMRLEAPNKDTPFTMSAEDFDALINNPRRFGWFADFAVSNGLEQAPELAQLRAQLSALERDVLARKRAYYAPDVNVQAQYTDNIDASGLGAGTDLDQLNDWSVSVNASWPLWDSGTRRAALSRSRQQAQQVRTQIDATAQRIEQNIRAALYSAQASYVNIELSERGADASRKNLALVSDAYRQGTVTVIQLLDAQNQSLQADLAANNAVQDFLIDIMNLQRAVSSFDFLLAPEEQAERTRAILSYIEEREALRNAPGERP